MTYNFGGRDGQMDAAGPKPCASVQGTTLLVEDLFYNVNTRKQARLLGLQSTAILQSCKLTAAAKYAGIEEQQ